MFDVSHTPQKFTKPIIVNNISRLPGQVKLWMKDLKVHLTAVVIFHLIIKFVVIFIYKIYRIDKN